jgi:hypothetical protein
MRVIIFIGALVTFRSASADIRSATSCSATDVALAIGLASAGDIITVPAGTCTWLVNVTIDKQLTIHGAGIDSTIIKERGFRLSSGLNNVRITGFTFDGNYTAAAFLVGIANKNFRIDNNKFMNRPYSTSNSITMTGYSYGLIDSNQFLNTCDETIGIGADNSAAFARPGIGGYDNGTIFIEDNTFMLTAAGAGAGKCGADSAENIFDGNSGTRYVFRYNTVINSPALRWQKALEMHGFESEFAPPPGDARGVYSVEIYNNTFITNWAGSGIIGVKLRGGRGVIYNNTFQQGQGCASACSWGTLVLLSNYRSDSNNSGSVVKSAMNRVGYTQWSHFRQSDEGAYTCEHCGGHIALNRDQIQELYIWNNPGSGSIKVDPGGYNQQDILLGTHYFTSAIPAYTPYPYPHPLRLASGSPPDAPKNLRIINTN